MYWCHQLLIGLYVVVHSMEITIVKYGKKKLNSHFKCFEVIVFDNLQQQQNRSLSNEAQPVPRIKNIYQMYFKINSNAIQ